MTTFTGKCVAVFRDGSVVGSFVLGELLYAGLFGGLGLEEGCVEEVCGVWIVGEGVLWGCEEVGDCVVIVAG